MQDSDHKVTLSQFRGQVVVLNFWATWCPPCIEETPSLVRMQARLKDKGVVVLAVSIDADDAAYHKFLKDYSVNMVTVRDEARKRLRSTARLAGRKPTSSTARESFAASLSGRWIGRVRK